MSQKMEEDLETEASGGRDARVKEEPFMEPTDVDDFVFPAVPSMFKEESPEAVVKGPSREDTDWCGVSDLYADHAVKGDLVVGPECLQPRDVAYALRAVPSMYKEESPKAVVKEPSREDTDWCGVSDLYADHAVKGDLVVGPERLQPRDVAYTLRVPSMYKEESPEAVVKEPSREETDWCGVSDLYADHAVKGDLVVGPERLQPRDVAYTLRAVPSMYKEESPKAVVKEPSREETDWCGVSDLYADHAVKGDLVVGPERLQPRDVAYTLRAASAQSEDSRKLSPSPGRIDKSPLQLTDCYVKLERESVLDPEPSTSHDTEDSEGSDEAEINSSLPLTPDIRDCYVRLVRCDQIKQTSDPLKINVYECDTCGRKFRTKCSLSQHLRVHLSLHLRVNIHPKKLKLNFSHTETKYSCELCGKNFANKSRLLCHEKIHFKGFLCTICNKQLKHASNFRAHIRSHTGFRPYSCEVCSKTFKQSSHLNTHKLTHIDVSNYSCEICNKEFKRLDCLKVHLLTHAAERRYPCEICKKIFSSPKCVRTHQIVHTKVKSFSCNVCEKTFAYSQQLKMHKLTHADVKPYCCEICQERFKTVSDLKYHERVHTHDELHSCKICKKHFKTARGLYEHRSVHSEKVYCCGVCRKVFKSMYSLKRHNDMHEGKKYSCNVCKKDFKRSDSLMVHERTHTGLKPYSCHVCAKKFAESGALKVHQLVHYNDAIKK